MRGFEQQIANQISRDRGQSGRAHAIFMNAHGILPLTTWPLSRTGAWCSLANFNPSQLDRDARSGATETVYAAASVTWKLGLIDISNRAWNRVRLEGNTKRATVEEARNLTPRSTPSVGPIASPAAGMGRMEQFMQRRC